MHAPFLPDLPRRWGAKLSALFSRDGFHAHPEKARVALVEQSDQRPGLLPLDAGDDAIYQAADAAAREVYSYCERWRVSSLIVDGIFLLCLRMHVPRPTGATEKEIIARAVDKGWWVRAIRKQHARRFEYAAIQLGFTGYHAGVYLSHESVERQARRNRQNAQLLAKTELENEHGQRFTLAELAELGVANKAIRRGELMTRIRGFEEIAQDLRHVGVFGTLTCPSKYHGVLSASGEPNPKYVAFGSPTPRDAQRYLCQVWARARAALHREGIHAYGFRIAEPHHDGCPHWHMLMFVAPEQVERYEAILRKHALAEDGYEAGAEKNRVKFVRIDAGKGTAAGYIAKYIAKNIDGVGVGDHKTVDGYFVTSDLINGEEIVPSARVTYWSQTWGIRQFQQIGGAPVTVWRELRRVKADAVQRAPQVIKDAWLAVQKIEGSPEIAKQASWADYLRAQGGPVVGRAGSIQIATRKTVVHGRYAIYEQDKPAGVYVAGNPMAVYESVRYQWRAVAPVEAVAVPWTGVNNCTVQPPAEWIEALKNQKICSANGATWWDGERTEVRPDPAGIETYQRHRKNAPAAHLASLRAKFRDNHV